MDAKPADLEAVDQTLQAQVDALLTEVRAGRDLSVAETALRVLARVCVKHPNKDGSGSYLILS